MRIQSKFKQIYQERVLINGVTIKEDPRELKPTEREMLVSRPHLEQAAPEKGCTELEL